MRDQYWDGGRCLAKSVQVGWPEDQDRSGTAGPNRLHRGPYIGEELAAVDVSFDPSPVMEDGPAFPTHVLCWLRAAF